MLIWVAVAPFGIDSHVSTQLTPLCMARRASSKIRPLWVACILGALVLAIVVGIVLQNQGGDPFRTVPELNLGDYLANANSLQGNTYKVKGVIAQSLGYSHGRGRLFSVEVNSSGGEGVLPVLVPPELSYLNLQKGQHYTLLLEVGDTGLLLARKMQKG